MRSSNGDCGKTTQHFAVMSASDGKYVTVDQDVANLMNMYSCEIGEKLQDAIPNLGYDYKRYLLIRVENTFFLSPTNIDEILNEM